MASRAPNFANDDAAIDGGREWFTAAELAEMRLPGLPTEKRSINRRAQENRWSTRTDKDGELLVRPRQGRGGGVEFHISLLPGAARVEMARRGITSEGEEAGKEAQRSALWIWFDRQTDKVRKEAEFRLAAVNEVELLISAGLTKTAAVAEVCAAKGVGRSTLWGWIEDVAGVAATDRLPTLASKRRGGGKTSTIDEDIWRVFKRDYLRPEAPTLTSCYDRAVAIAAERGISIPSERTFSRRLKAEIPRDLLILKREGEEELRKRIPANRRHVDQLHAMEAVNIDGHKFDVFVKERETGKVIRPLMVAIQDIRSSKIVAWRIGETESADLTRLAFADLFRNFGIPKHCVLDNGRAFASKWITGGSANRFRFKVKDSDPTGLLTGLGVEIHWALPFRGQSKPIERAFRVLADRISRAPEAHGAYTGPNPMKKPANYGERVMEWDDFVALVAKGITQHNAKQGRRGRDYAGRSFDQVFAETYASVPIQKATEPQLRMALLAAEQKMVNRKTGEISLMGNRYWSSDCGEYAGQRVIVRFDPDNLHSEVHLYAQEDGRFLCTAPVIDDTGFFDVDGAKKTAKRWADTKKKAKAAAEAEQLMDAEALIAAQAKVETPELPEPSVVRPVRHRGQTAAALKMQPQRQELPENEDAKAREARMRKVFRLVGGDED